MGVDELNDKVSQGNLGKLFHSPAVQDHLERELNVSTATVSTFTERQA